MNRSIGKRGTPLHDAIVDWVRFDLITHIRTVFSDLDWSCITHDGLMGELLGTMGDATNKGGYFPDCIWDYGESCVVIEVGHCDLMNVLPEIQTLDIGFDGQINIVNPKDSFVFDIANVIRDYVKEFGFPHLS